MKNKLYEMWYFTKLLSKKWMLWVSFVIGLIVIALDFMFSIDNLPSYVYWIVFLIGLFWSSYQVFQDISKKIPKNVNNLVEPKLTINFIEGGEYDFTLLISDEYEAAKILPSSELRLNLRIENIGEIGVDILSIKSDYYGRSTKQTLSEIMGTVGPLSASNSRNIYLNKEKMRFPVHLEPGQIIHCEVLISINPHILLTNAQIASRLQALQSSSSNYSYFKVIMEIVGKTSDFFTFDNMIKVCFRPLWDFYVNHWVGLQEDDLVRLAGGTYLPPNEKSIELSTPPD